MDFWARLVKGSPKKRVQSTNTPQIRLSHLKRAYNSLLQIWHNGDGVSEDAFVIENVCICLRRIAELLQDDQRGPTPHLCVSFAATSRVLVTVARISAAFQTDKIVKESLGICQLLIDSEEEAFLEDKGFVDVLPDFVESIQRLVRRIEDGQTEATLVEVLFSITAKLRIEPHLLRLWFRPEKPEEDEEELTEEERRTRWEEFPLFYTLLHYVPFEGRAGEFSRMGLVYIVELATVASDLEKWLVEGDMAALMASSLGALYSQLSRKLVIQYSSDEMPSILAFSERQLASTVLDGESTISESYQSHLGTFLSSLKFWQDLIEHCRSEDVKHTLLDHFEYLFLRQLLYPSLVESSDVDGGSSVAVLTYLKHILEYTDNPDLTKITLQYLFGIQRSDSQAKIPTTPLFRTRSRKSEDLLTSLYDDDQPTPELFNLSALIFTSLGSNSQQTVTATLQIVSTMLRGPDHQSLTSLLRTRPVLLSDSMRTIGAHEKEIETFLSLAEDLTGFQDLETSYEHHIQDCRSNLETHPCSIQLLNLPAGNRSDASLENRHELQLPKILILEDATFSNLVLLLDKFFVNDIETNLGLTQVLMDLASCGYVRLELWLLSNPTSYEYSNTLRTVVSDNNADIDSSSHGMTTQQIDDMRRAKISPKIPANARSPVFQSLSKLIKTLAAIRRRIQDFETHLQVCRALIDRPSRQPSPSITPSRSPSRYDTPYGTPSGKGASLSTATPAPILSPTKFSTSNSAARDTSPRGRQENRVLEYGTPPSLVSRFGHLQLSPSRTPRLQSANSTPSRSPLRAVNLAPATPAPTIPTALWQRIQIDKHSSLQSKEAPESDSSDSDSDASSIGPGIEELSPTDAISTPSKSRLLVVPGGSKTKTKSRTTSFPRRRGRDGSVGGKDAKNTSDEEDSDEPDNTTSIPVGPRTEPKNDGTVSLGHLLTNVIILQEFILELAAVIEVRGALFEEVRYS